MERSRGLEPLFPTWQADVLTAGRTSRNCFKALIDFDRTEIRHFEACLYSLLYIIYIDVIALYAKHLSVYFLEPEIGVEPITSRLQNGCSAN